MTPRERLLTALDRTVPDRLPVSTYQLMDYFIRQYMGGATERECWDRFGLDAILWITPYRPDANKGEYLAPLAGEYGLGIRRHLSSPDWRVECESLAGEAYPTARYRFATPRGELTMVAQANEHTVWIAEHLIKEKNDIDLIADFVTTPSCDVETVNEAARDLGDRGIVRGWVCFFDIFGQPGCWQDAACLVGIQDLIMATYDDPGWVHQLLEILQRRKLGFIESMAGARYDVVELGGGDASSTVISPAIFDEFVAPYDAELISAAHRVGLRVVYHTCGGMMPLLEAIADMGPDVMETFTPAGMGGDADLGLAKKRIGDRVCMMGGFDQFHHFHGCSPEETRAAVRRCFEEAGAGGGYILAPSDHFFDADPELVKAFTDEARQCAY